MTKKMLDFLNKRSSEMRHGFLKPEKVELYKWIHANIPEEDLEDMSFGNLRNYSIWVFEADLYDYQDKKSPEEIAEEPKRIKIERPRKEGEALSPPCFLYHDQQHYYDYPDVIVHERLEIEDDTEVVDLYDRQRFVFRTRIIPEKRDAFVQALQGIGADMNLALRSYGIRNYHVSLREADAYVYYEYAGDQYEEDKKKMTEDPVFARLGRDVEDCLLCENGQFHYDRYEQVFYFTYRP